jgi:hypothetical protein
VTLDGHVIDVLMTATRPGLITDPGMSVMGIIDITERVRAQEKLQRVQGKFADAARLSMLGELTASIAHEVNQPLTGIVTNGQVGLRLLNAPELVLAEMRELTKSVVDDARRAADIIVRVRAMATRQAPEQTLLSLDEAIRDGPDVSPSRSPIAWADSNSPHQPRSAESACRPHADPAGNRQSNGQRDPGNGTRGKATAHSRYPNHALRPAHPMLHFRRQRPRHQAGASRFSL